MKANVSSKPRTGPEEVQIDPTKLEEIELHLYKFKKMQEIATTIKPVSTKHIVLPTDEEADLRLSPIL
jgi:hypothetical protein